MTQKRYKEVIVENKEKNKWEIRYVPIKTIDEVAREEDRKIRFEGIKDQIPLLVAMIVVFVLLLSI